MNTWFRMETSSETPTVADIYIFDIIGGWIDDIYRALGWDFGTTTAKTFLEELSKLPDSVKTLRLHINSPGGDVFGAATIANTLRDQKVSKGRTVNVLIEGLAASAASVIAMAGDTVEMADNALMMIHNPWTIAVGEAKDFQKVIDELQKIRGTIVTTYQWHSELEREAIEALMDAETWLDADEAIAKGLATKKTEGLKAAALIAPASMVKLTIPDKFKDRVSAFVTKPTPPAPAASAIDVMRMCREGGCLDLAEGLVSAQATLEAVTAKVNETKTARAAAEARSTEITAICAKAKLPELAAGYIKGGMAVADIKAHIVTLTAKLSAPDIDGGLDPNRGASTSASWKTAFSKAKSHGLTRH